MENKVLEEWEISREHHGSLTLIYEGIEYIVSYRVRIILEHKTTIVSTYFNTDIKTSLKNKIRAFLAEYLKQKYE